MHGKGDESCGLNESWEWLKGGGLTDSERFRGTVQSFANNARGFRQLVGSKWPREPRPMGVETQAQHAFGFMGASGRKSDFPWGRRNAGIK